MHLFSGYRWHYSVNTGEKGGVWTLLESEIKRLAKADEDRNPNQDAFVKSLVCCSSIPVGMALRQRVSDRTQTLVSGPD